MSTAFQVITSSSTIDQHTGTTTMGCFIVCVDVSINAALTEDNDGQFFFEINYNYSGVVSGNGHATVGPIIGNTQGQYSPQGHPELIIRYEITNWNLTQTYISLNVSLSLEYTNVIHMGPNPVFNNQQFAGNRVKVQLEANQELLAKFQKFDTAIHKAIGVSCSDLYQHV